MRAILLAGGPAGREPGVPKELPRPLWPVLLRPIILALIERLARGGVTSMTLCANGRTHIYADRLTRTRLKLAELRFSEDVSPRGPAGCVKDSAGFVAGKPFIIANAACWFSDNVSWLFDQHRRRKNQLTVFCHPGSSIPSGIYVCNPSVLDHIPESGYCDIKEQLIPKLLDRGCKVGASHLGGLTGQVLNPQSYLALHHRTLVSATETRNGDRWNEYRPYAPGIWIGDNASIATRARLYGPIMMGSRARIENDAVVIGPTTIGPGAVVGEEAVVTECAVWANARIAPGSVCSTAIVPAVHCETSQSRLHARTRWTGTAGKPLLNKSPIAAGMQTGR